MIRNHASQVARLAFARSPGLLLAGLLLATLSGCAVPQPRGEGRLDRLRDPTTRRSYYLYLPKEYVNASEAERQNRAWPIVITFHGMKPFDVAHSQAREWQQEADRYGYIVIAPILNAFSVFGEFPLKRVNSALRSDEEATLAILNHVYQTTAAKREHVLSTGFSSGGYMAHYMLNRHPDVFTCLAVRQSNFSPEVLDPTLVPRSRYHPVLVVWTQNDLGICKRESREAVNWYDRHNYKNFAWVKMNRLGHERTPDTAADFFARVCGATPNRRPNVLVSRQAIDGNPTGLALLAGKLKPMEQPPDDRSHSGSALIKPSADVQPTRPPTRVAKKNPPRQSSPPPNRQRQNAAAQPTPERAARVAWAPRQVRPVSISVSSAIGFEPLLITYTADCPVAWQHTAKFHWTLDGQPIGQGVNGQRTIPAPGDYKLGLLVVTDQGKEHRVSRRIRVLPGIEDAAHSN